MFSSIGSGSQDGNFTVVGEPLIIAQTGNQLQPMSHMLAGLLPFFKIFFLFFLIVILQEGLMNWLQSRKTKRNETASDRGYKK